MWDHAASMSVARGIRAKPALGCFLPRLSKIALVPRSDGVFSAVSYLGTALWSLANSIARGGTFCAGYREYWLALR